MGLFSNSNNSYKQWCESPRGKKFMERVRFDAEENARNNAEWEANTPPEKKEQVKLFKIIVTPILLFFGIADFFSMMIYKFPFIFAAELIIALIGFILFKKNPFKVKYPNCFFMAPVAFFASCLFSIYLCISCFNFKQAVMIKQPDAETETIVENIEIENMSEHDFLNRDYSKWLKDNNFETSEELSSDYIKLKEENGQ